jgi:hypothetical protein
LVKLLATGKSSSAKIASQMEDEQVTRGLETLGL